MLTSTYIPQVQSLLHDPNAQFWSTSELTTFINEARQQIALEGECIEASASLSTTSNVNSYLHSAVTAPSTPSGINALLAVRSISYGGAVLESRPWDWFNFYFLNLAAPAQGAPTAWCPRIPGQQGQFYIAPTPNGVFSISIDGTWLPINLASESDPEAIPYPWQDAVAFYAAYLANKNAQRPVDADNNRQLYEEYMQRARGGVTPLVTPTSFPGGIPARVMPGQAAPDSARLSLISKAG